MMCFSGRCIHKLNSRSAAIHGGWADWTNWEECSRTCGSGVQFRYRACTKPTPSYGGRECVGDNSEARVCQTQPCRTNSGKLKVIDFRQEQCSDITTVRHSMRETWMSIEPSMYYPSPNSREQCDLVCRRKSDREIINHNSILKDGTPCSYLDKHRMCIGGSCVQVGCDNIIGSTKTFNLCGICGGHKNSCKQVRDHTLSLTNAKAKQSRRGYFRTFSNTTKQDINIPKGAYNVIIH